MSGVDKAFDIVELKRKTIALPDLTSFITAVYNGVVEYDTGEGTILGFPLYNTPRVAVQRHFLSAGTVFGSHTHEEKEWIMVYEGELMITIEEEEETLSLSDYVCIDIGLKHSLRAVVDTWLICVSIPAAKGYPIPG